MLSKSNGTEKEHHKSHICSHFTCNGLGEHLYFSIHILKGVNQAIRMVEYINLTNVNVQPKGEEREEDEIWNIFSSQKYINSISYSTIIQ